MSEVVLREVRDGDEDVLYRAFTDLDSWEQRSPSPSRPVSREQWRTQRADRPSEPWQAEFVIEADGRPVGQCSLFDVDHLARHCEIGIALVPEARGRGCGTSALRELVAFGFERWNLHRLHLVMLASNTAARRAYEKVGFVEEGRLREHAWVRGSWDDEVRMGLLRSQWRSGHR